MRKFLIAANWKMNTNIEDGINLIKNINSSDNENIDILICPPLTHLSSIYSNKSNNIKIGAQNSYFENKGAFTGEVSNSMLKSVGCENVIVGHSERRSIFNEDNSLINRKLASSIQSGLTPILCVGESLEQRENGSTNQVLQEQLDECLLNIQASKCVIAYEPIWAIGTGITPTLNQISETHSFIKDHLENKHNYPKPIILYGGSLKDTNAEEILSIESVNGGLIGGASLVAEKFNKIIEMAESLAK